MLMPTTEFYRYCGSENAAFGHNVRSRYLDAARHQAKLFLDEITAHELALRKRIYPQRSNQINLLNNSHFYH